MLQGEHSAILSTLIKLPFVIKIFVLSIFEWPLKTDFTVQTIPPCLITKKKPGKLLLVDAPYGLQSSHCDLCQSFRYFILIRMSSIAGLELDINGIIG